MVEINLLPWRIYKQTYQNKIIKRMLLLTFFCSVLGLGIVHYLLSARETARMTRINMLQNEQRLMLVQKLPAPPLLTPQRELTTLFNELSKMNANEVCFTRIMRNNNTTIFIGKAHSAADLTDYLKNWRAAILFSQIKIIRLEQKNPTVMNFRFEALGTLA